MSIVVIGTIYVDIKGHPTAIFDPAGRNAGTIAEFHGGVGRNIAEDIGNIGIKPIFVSLASTNGSGGGVIERLNAHNVDTTYIRRTDDGMGTWLAIFDNEGDVYANISARPNLKPILDILKENSEAIFADADGILLELDMGEEIIDYTFEMAEKYGKKVYGVISNINIALKIRNKILKTDCFICNQQESGVFFSENFEDISADEMLSALPARVKNAGLNRMIVTMGEKGSVYADKNGDCGICPPKKVSVIDTTGAGDSFFAGASVALSLGKSLKEAAEIGTAMAASVIATEENVCPVFAKEEFGL